MIIVIGGTYREIEYDDISLEIFGSGFRSSKFLLENNCEVKFYTSGNSDVLNFLKENKKVYKNFSFQCQDYHEFITFKYCFSLDQPSIFPNLLNITKTEELSVQAQNIVAFGMLETEFKLDGNKIIYDPQTSIKPIKFSQIGTANELIYIVNKKEAEALASSKQIDEIKDFFFITEGTKAFIIKNGPFGATLYTEDGEINVPAYITKNVHKIGSGDIFTSSFAYYWMEKGMSISDAVLFASKSTASFCDKKVYIDSSKPGFSDYKVFKYKDISSKQVYLASPFFSIADLILIDKVRSAFLDFGVNVFSPFHDIGIGNEIAIARKDLDGINNSEIIFLILDNLDSGTLVEAGYSFAKEKKMIGYQRTCNDSDILMLKPSEMKIFNHITTAIYHTIWNL